MSTKKIASILIVDDDRISVMIAEALLQKYFHIHSAANGPEAMSVMEQEQIDIVLMDINLGDEVMDGIKTMKAIRQDGRYAHAKIFAVTACSDNDKEWYLQQGFDDLYIKPIIKEEMIEVINQSFPAGRHVNDHTRQLRLEYITKML